MPLFAFNVGIEAGQITVLTLALLLLTGVDRVMERTVPTRGLMLRAVATSLIAAGCAAVMAFQRAPW